MKNLKHFLSVIMCVLCVLMVVSCFASCGGDDPEVETNETNTQAATVVTDEVETTSEVVTGEAVTQSETILEEETVEPVTYSLTFDFGYEGDSDITMTYGETDTVLLPAADREGYIFDGWYNGDTKVENLTAAATCGNATLVAKWTALPAIVFDYNYEGAENMTVAYNLGDKVILPTPTRAGYRFDAWMNGEEIAVDGADISAYGNIATLVAHWTYTPTVVFNPNIAGSAPIDVVVVAGETVSPVTVTRENYKFAGWMLDGAAYDFSKPVKGELVLTAVWEGQKTVTFDVEAGEIAPTMLAAFEGDTVILPKMDSAYPDAFMGWTINGVNYAVGSSYTVGSESVVATANYRQLTVEFINENGSVVSTATVKANTTIANDVIPSLDKIHEKAYYSVQGWDYDFTAPVTEDVKIAPAYKYVASDDKFFLYTPVDAQGNQLAADATQGVVGYYVRSNEDIAAEAWDEVLRLPEEHNGLPVIGILPGTKANEGAFRAHTGYKPAFKTVVIPAGYTSIAPYAFYDASSISATSPYGFLEDVIFLGDQITSIGECAFQGTGIKKVVIPATVTAIGDKAFMHADFTEIVFEERTLPLTIGEQAFYSRSAPVEKLEIPAAVTKIGAGAFANLGMISELTFADGDLPLEIGDFAFSSSSVALPTSTISTVTTYPMLAKKIVLPARVTTLGVGAFYCQVNLEEIDMTASAVKEISDYAFLQAVSLKTIGFPKGVTTIGKSAFALVGTKATSTTVYAGEWSGEGEDATFSYKKVTTHGLTTQLTTLTIPGTVTLIDEKAFVDHGHALTSLVFEAAGDAKAELVIGADAFSIWNAPMSTKSSPAADEKANLVLTSLVFPAHLVSVEGLRDYAAVATVDFSACTKLKNIGNFFLTGQMVENNQLTSIVIPDTVETIGSDFLDSCVALQSVTLGANLREIGNDFCFEATALTSIHIPANVEVIGSSFCKGAALSSVTFAENSKLTIIGNMFCSNLSNSNSGVMYFDGTEESLVTSVTIPASVQHIGYQFFASYPTLTEFKVADGKNPGFMAVDGVLYTADGTTLAVYPYGKTDATYKLIDSCTTISIDNYNVTTGAITQGNGYAFAFHPYLTEVDFNNLKEIVTTNNFLSTKLEKVEINVTEIPNATFQKCASLKTIILGENVRYVQTNAFNGCASDATLEIRSTTIDFATKTSITKITGGITVYGNEIKNILLADTELVSTFGKVADLEAAINVVEVNIYKADEIVNGTDVYTGIVIVYRNGNVFSFTAMLGDTPVVLNAGVYDANSRCFAAGNLLIKVDPATASVVSINTLTNAQKTIASLVAYQTYESGLFKVVVGVDGSALLTINKSTIYADLTIASTAQNVDGTTTLTFTNDAGVVIALVIDKNGQLVKIGADGFEEKAAVLLTSTTVLKIYGVDAAGKQDKYTYVNISSAGKVTAYVKIGTSNTARALTGSFSISGMVWSDSDTFVVNGLGMNTQYAPNNVYTLEVINGVCVATYIQVGIDE